MGVSVPKPVVERAVKRRAALRFAQAQQFWHQIYQTLPRAATRCAFSIAVPRTNTTSSNMLLTTQA